MDERLMRASSELHHTVTTQGDRMTIEDRRTLYGEISRIIRLIIHKLSGNPGIGGTNNYHQLSVEHGTNTSITHYDPSNSKISYSPVAYDASKNYSTVWVLTPVSTGSANFYLRSYVAVGAKMTLTQVENGDDYIVEFKETSDPEYQVINSESNNKHTFSIEGVKSCGGTVTVYLVPDPSYHIKGVTSSSSANVWTMESISVPL